jgi:hypothetical protein
MRRIFAALRCRFRHRRSPAFRTHRIQGPAIYATLAPGGRTANLMLTPDEQALKCEVAPEAFSPIRNAWGARGATTAKLSALTVAELRNALETAWQHAVSKRR